MNLLDLLLVVIVGISVVAGFVAGFARVGIGFIATISGIVVRLLVLRNCRRPGFTTTVMSVNASNMLGFFVVFLAVLLSAGALIGKLLSKLFKWTGLSWLDRLLGGAFGLVRGIADRPWPSSPCCWRSRPSLCPTGWWTRRCCPTRIDASNLCATLAPDAVKEAFRDSIVRDPQASGTKSCKKKRKKTGITICKKGRQSEGRPSDLRSGRHADRFQTRPGRFGQRHARLDRGEPPLADETVYSYVGNGAPVLVRRALPGRHRRGMPARAAIFSRLLSRAHAGCDHALSRRARGARPLHDAGSRWPC